MSTRSSKLVQSLWKTNWTTRTGCTRPVQGAARPMSPPRAEFLVSYREVRLSVYPSIEKNTSSARSRISSNTCAKRCPLQAGPLNATQNPLFVAAPHCDNDVLYFAPKCHRGRHAGTTACSLWSKIAGPLNATQNPLLPHRIAITTYCTSRRNATEGVTPAPPRVRCGAK